MLFDFFPIAVPNPRGVRVGAVTRRVAALPQSLPLFPSGAASNPEGVGAASNPEGVRGYTRGEVDKLFWYYITT